MNSSHSNKGSQKTPSQVTSALNASLMFHKLLSKYAANITASICTANTCYKFQRHLEHPKRNVLDLV